jgi:hypothetical protein
MTIVQQFYDTHQTKVINGKLQRILMSYLTQKIASQKQTHESLLERS